MRREYDPACPNVVRRSPCNRLRNQNLGRNAEALVESADHGQRQRAFAVEHFVDAIALANDWLKILDGHPALLHPEFDRFHRVWRSDGHVLGLVGLHQRREDVQTITLWVPSTKL